MKSKILILSIEQHLHELLLSTKLKPLAETYDIIFASCLEDALDEIAKAKLIDDNPIAGLVFQRKTLVANQDKCRLVKNFAERYATSSVVAINMIYNDHDGESRDYAVSSKICFQDDWDAVKVNLDS